MTWLGLLLTLAITLRITRLVTKDKIAQPFRDAVDRRYGDESMLAYQVRCPWCFGFWVAIAAALGSHWWADEWGWQCFAVACAASWLTGIATLWLDE